MFLDDESLLIDKIESTVADLTIGGRAIRVLPAAEMALVEDQSQAVPAVFVVYDGHEPTNALAHGAIQEIEQHWIIVVAVRNARGQLNGQATRQDAGSMIDVILPALLGWKPDATGSSFRLVKSPAPTFADGLGFFPFTFTRRRSFRGGN